MESSRKLTIAILFLHSVVTSGLLEFRPGGGNRELADDDGNNRKGFSLELVHCDSVDSPLYPGNLTSVERMQRDTRLSESRRLWLESISATVAAAGPQDLNIRPILSNSNVATYTVKVVIGTVESHLVVDTGSHLVWIQREPCNTCFEHDGPGYTPTQSPSYRTIPPTHPICKPPLFQRSPDGQQCTYEFKYGFDGRYTRGYLAFEKFEFESKNDPRSLAAVDDVIFGASSNNSRDFFVNNRKLTGILGMGRDDVSFPKQMARRDPQLGRFSYCLAPEDGASSHLRFGTDVIMRGDYQTTPLLQETVSSWYYLNLLDVSINGEALHLPPDTFLPNPNIWWSGGVVLDSGTPKTYFIQRAYEEIKAALVNYFGRLKLKRIRTSDAQRLCYRMPRGGSFDAFPDMGFHLEGGATLRPDRNQVFNINMERRKFCLFMAPSTSLTIIGARVQGRLQHFGGPRPIS